MGNCVSLQLGLDRLLNGCADRATEEVMYIWQLQDNIEALNTSKDLLKASMDDLNRRIKNLEGPLTKRLHVVDLWLTSAEKKLTEASKLIKDGEVEVSEKSCCGGCCYKNSIATHTLGKSVVDEKVQLDAMIETGKFDSVVERIPDEPDYVRDLKKDVKDLKVSRNSLESSKDDLIRKVRKDEGGRMKILERVRVWISEAEQLISEVDRMLIVAPQEIEKLQVNDFSNGGFGGNVAEKLKDVKRLIKDGKFEVVVESVESEYVSKVEDHIRELKRFRRELSGLSGDVMEKVKAEEEREGRVRLRQVKVWQEAALETIADTDKLLNVEAPREIENLSKGSSSSSFGARVEKMLKDVVYQIKKGEFQEYTAERPPEAVVEIDCDHIGETVGLQTKLDEAWKVLMKPEVGILGLYGLGGVGKTTLLTHINNKFLHNNPGDFDFVIWIVVSKDFTLSKVQEEIGDRIGISVNDWKKKEIGEKSKDIRNLLRKKKFVLLLDDLWEKVHLEKAGVPIPKRQNGSKIVLTTRSELVCSLMDAKKRIKVEKLPPEQAWKLFEDKVGKDTFAADPAIRPIAELVAKECDGLPLALIVVARAMACSKTAKEWGYALADLQQSASDLQGIKDEVFARLKLSYDRLPDDKYRSCFIYCALFPEDYKINKDDLVDYWISEKFEFDHDEPITRAKAHHIVRDLVNVCLLEEEGKFVKLHDMIRDMALWISCDLDKKKYNFLVQAGKQLNKAPDVVKWQRVRRASLMENSIRNIPEVSVCPDLRTLLLCRNPRLYEINGSIFKFSRALTVLDLSNTRIHVLPMGVTELFSLQYLNLSRTWIQQLPPELKRLRKLIYLNLEHNDLLGMIPKGVISSFLCLQVLRMFRSGFFYSGEDDNILSDSNVHIEEIQQLKLLNVVSITIRSIDALGVYFNTENVQSCTQSLSLECLGDPNSKSGDPKLKSIDPKWKSIEFLPTEDMDQLETLHISASEHLEQINFSPKFRFSSLREVVVEYCPRLLNLNWLHRAPNLAVLRVAVCEKMVEISDNAMPFAKLEVLELEGLPQLESICYKVSSLPAIKRIRVLDCPLLKKVPLNPDILKVRKIVIEAEDQWWKDLELKDQSNKEAFQSCFRSYPPRTRICRAPHHYFDIWNKYYS
ncbi:Disease resistance protein (CC-NBS-LRR class) family [Euphorbia peplus]|nr:Disease resistance protein (CC-NBS-LRR class) family [Euphorbia peplus]